jgi:hypothetical protein
MPELTEGYRDLILVLAVVQVQQTRYTDSFLNRLRTFFEL